MVKNCFNYVGNKDRILPLIQENVDKSKKNFVDLFCGSGTVGVNLVDDYDRIILNDACWQMIETLKWLGSTSLSSITYEIDKIIKKYKLSKDNKEGFLELREYYNSDPYLQLVFEPATFYCLVTHSFNYNIHINSEGKFSVPSGAGRCYLNPQLRQRLEAFQWELESNKDKIRYKNCDFVELIDKASKAIPNTMFYVDPPYLSSDSSYGRIHYLGQWDENKERKLYEKLDHINLNGGSFLLSNVLENNGKVNTILKEWSKKYNVIDVETSYSNCNYQRKNNGDTIEVLVKNY